MEEPILGRRWTDTLDAPLASAGDNSGQDTVHSADSGQGTVDEPATDDTGGHGTVAEQIWRFQRLRDQAKADERRRVVMLGLGATGIGVISYGVVYGVAKHLVEVWEPAALFLMLLGALMVTSMTLDIDAELAEKRWLEVVCFSVLTSAPAVLGLLDSPTYFAAVLPGGFGLLQALLRFRRVSEAVPDVEAASLPGTPPAGVTDEDHCVSRTTIIAGWANTFLVTCSGARLVFYATYMNSCCVSYRSHTARYASIVVGAAMIGPLTAVSWWRWWLVRSSQQRDTVSHQTSGNPSGLYEVIHDGTVCWGLQYLVLALTRELNGPSELWIGHHGASSSSEACRIAVAVAYIVMPFLLAKSRGHLVRLMNNLFERKQRLKDGAFLAALLADVDVESLMVKGRQRLRRVRLDKLDLTVMSSSKGDNAAVESLSEVCEVGDIDYFLSHSWSDDPNQKVEALQRLAQQFRAAKGREAYVWLDKLCIDQQNIADDLQCLPVFLMACKKLLILAGPTYPQRLVSIPPMCGFTIVAVRLWCAWEMYVFFSMSPDTRRLKIVTLGDTDDTLHKLQNFRASEAHCWAPEDEALLRSIINENVSNFERNIRQHAQHAAMD